MMGGQQLRMLVAGLARVQSRMGLNPGGPSYEDLISQHLSPLRDFRSLDSGFLGLACQANACRRFATIQRWAMGKLGMCGMPTLALLLSCVAMGNLGNLHAQTPTLPAVSSTDVIGSSLSTAQLPMRGVPATRTGGMTCDVQFGQESVVGYVATKITVQAQGKFASDRDLVFRFRGVDDAVYPPRRNLVVDAPVLVQQGTASQTFTRYLPRWAITQQIAIEVLEDGRLIPDLEAQISFQLGASQNPNFQQGNNASFRYSAIALQSEQTLNALMAIGEDTPTKAESNLLKSLSNLIEAPVEVHPTSRMPTDWRAYQRFDAIILSQSLCEQLVQQTDAFYAVRYWLMMGGTVVMTGDSDLAAIMAGLGITDVSEERSDQQVESAVADLKSDWEQRMTNAKDTLAYLAANPEKALSQPAMMTQTLNRGAEHYPSMDVRIAMLETNFQSYRQALTRTPVQWNRRLWIRRVAAGQVIGVPSSPESGAVEEADLNVVQSLIGFRISPMLRRGVDPMIGDSRFRDWLIPGVAQPPVYTFIGLLTAFVILVGPVAYRQTAKHHRSHLMFLIAPVLAIITTAMMFAYGIVADGFGTMARIRQLTLVDGTSATGVERIRSTYFAGVRPADGLRFGGADEVMAYPESERIAWGDHLTQTPKTIGRVTVGEDYQRFDSSFLPSRSQTQFVVHRPIPDIGSLRLNTDSDKPATSRNPDTLTNGFGFPLRRIVVRQSKQKYLTVDFLAAGSTGEVNIAEDKDVSKKLGSLYNDFRPILSTSTESRTYQNSGKTMDLLREVMQTVAPSNGAYDGVFEFQFRDRLQSRLEIPVGHFIAISEVSEDVIAVEETEQVGCVRYVMGTFVEQQSQ